MAVLGGVDLDKYQPHLIVVEYSSPEERTELVNCLCPRGYFIWNDNGQDLFAVRGSALNHLRILPLGLWQMFIVNKLRKFFVKKIGRFVK